MTAIFNTEFLTQRRVTAAQAGLAICSEPSRAKRAPRGAEGAGLENWGCAPDPEGDRDNHSSILSLTIGWSRASSSFLFSGSAKTSAAMRRRSSGSGRRVCTTSSASRVSTPSSFKNFERRDLPQAIPPVSATFMFLEGQTLLTAVADCSFSCVSYCVRGV